MKIQVLESKQPIKALVMESFQMPGVPEQKHQALVEEAYQRGKAEGAEQVEQMSQKVTEIAGGFLGQLDVILKDTSEDLHKRLPHLVLVLAKQVLSSVELEEKDVVALLKDLMAESQDEPGELLVSEADLTFLGELFTPIQNQYPGLTVKGDPSLSSGQCFLKTKLGMVNGSLEKRIEVVEQQIVGESDVPVEV